MFGLFFLEFHEIFKIGFLGIFETYSQSYVGKKKKKDLLKSRKNSNKVDSNML